VITESLVNNFKAFAARSNRSIALLPTPQSENVGSNRALDSRDAVALRHMVKCGPAIEAAQENQHLAPRRGGRRR